MISDTAVSADFQAFDEVPFPLSTFDSQPSDVAQLRLPPQSIEAEQAILGGLMLDNQAWESVADRVSEGDFYRHDHRLIWQHIVKLIETARPADAITVAEALELNGDLSAVGGLVYLANLVNQTPSAANIRRYAEIVRERSILRRLAAIGVEITESAYLPQGKEASELLDAAEAKIFEVAQNTQKAKQGFLNFSQILKEIVEKIEVLYARTDDDDITGIPTRFADLDAKTSGLQGGDLIIVGGRPSMGKTAFAMNIAENVAIYARKKTKDGQEHSLPVAIFSMEMSGAQLAMRMVGSIGRIDQHTLKTGKLKDEDWAKLTHVLGALHDAKIYIDETPALTALEIRGRARRLARQHGGQLGLIVIDYLQLMSGSGRADNRTAELGEISRSLKGLARELNVPIIALSQLSRSLESRPNKRPMMSDLRESGAIEQDADLIIFMYRDEYYNPDSSDKGTAEAIVAKHRNGETGTVRLTWVGHHVRFENMAHGSWQANNE
jgi:replicative DNA helicase